ncbi:hypothetical protein ACIHFD_57580 [Nonomuraea sp. NPDC051941]|uniref:hypothetical protein n=1 Tax=Nonomuraea sp. NPDC051941 TaxID=3364373 RepID=UPI0037C9548F
MIWSPAPGDHRPSWRPSRRLSRTPITPTTPPLVSPPPPWEVLLPMLQVAALLGVVGWAVFLAVTADPWLAMLVVGLTCGLAHKIVTVIRAVERAQQAEPVAFDAGRVDLDHDDW